MYFMSIEIGSDGSTKDKFLYSPTAVNDGLIVQNFDKKKYELHRKLAFNCV